MTTSVLTDEQGQRLVALARWALEMHFAPDVEMTALEPDVSDPVFSEPRGTFVTLTQDGCLRGCIGCLTATEPLAGSVRRNALNAALHDPRFPALSANEVGGVRISLSVLTPASPFDYRDGDELLSRLRPGRDGVIVRKGGKSATFLPQVWDELSDPVQFLTALCLKAGLSGTAWRDDSLDVSVYQALYYKEDDSSGGARCCDASS